MSVSSTSTHFSTKGMHYVPPSAPLGHGVSKTHYIKPVPPTYVTEYEASYQWWPITAYAPHLIARCNGRPSRRSKARRRAVDSVMEWASLENVARHLINQEFEVQILSNMLPSIQNKTIDPQFVSAYSKASEFANQNIRNDENTDLCKEFVEICDTLMKLNTEATSTPAA